ncbi:TonB-dependent siderophore receptor [Porphyrobacter sp. GA68]|uniref:TonB-dependent receptor plug domain-containing protein n=1 Tax=Porphyrobacter sp. GA68 TaxID=2883480 RepID=UPI001D186D14|nr:TonB-dependent receptor [Porphyrobacter sp. GA68]
MPRTALLICASLFAIHSPALAQQAEQGGVPAADPDGAGNEIVVTGTRLRGEVITSQPPIAEYDERDVQALGAGSLAEVLEALAPQVSSGRGRGGGRPVILVNGRRISDFRELSSYPPEAVQKVSILPEEVALQYGFPADQRVVNFILKENFASREIEWEFEQPDRGGYRQTELELTYLRINGPDRLNVNVELAERTGLTNDERGVVLDAPVLPGDPDPARFRSLVAPTSSAEATVNWSRGLGVEGAGGAIALSGSYNRTDGRDLDGLATVLLVGPAPRQDSAFRALPYLLATETSTDTYSLGATLDKPLGEWRLNGTLNAILTEAETLVRNAPDFSGLQAAALSGAVPIRGILPDLPPVAPDLAQSRTITVENVVTLSGRPFELPAGRVSATLDAGYRWNRIASEDTRTNGAVELTRGRTSAGANLGLPIAERGGFLGAVGQVDLTVGGGVDHLSDFGTLWNANLGINWRPTERLSLQATYTPREAAPSLTQLGGPVIVRPSVPVFDFVTGQTALIALTTGGNPDLVAERQRDLKLALNWELPELSENIRNSSVDVEYFRNRSRDVSAAFPFLTPEIEAAFPGRVVRDPDGLLLAIDQRPVTFARQDASRIRFALNLGGSFRSDEEQSARGGPGAGGPGAGRAGAGGPAAMIGRGPPSGGRWRLTLDYTRELESTVLISAQGPELDLLNGDALVPGGVPENRFGARFFGFYNGIGGRLAFNWFSPTDVRGTGAPGSADLRFGGLAKLDLRVFTDLGRLFPETAALSGTRLSFLVDNVFDERQRVVDGDGVTPPRFQPFLLDPTGRYVGVEIRKLFL